MVCKKPIIITKNLPVSKYPKGLEVPCGKCLACRIKKRSEWVLRMKHELNYHDNNIFITLTYRPGKEPENRSLKKTDLQLFFKRLRRKLDNEERKIKYFACGEYGEPPKLLRFGRWSEGYRPHYHSIIFGMSLSDEDKLKIMEAWPYADWSQPDIRKNSFGLAEEDSIRYVAQYIDKKFSGNMEQEIYANTKRENVFRLLSNGIGSRYVDDNRSILVDSGYVTLRGSKSALPRYYLKRLGMDTELFKQHSLEKDAEKVEKYTGLYMQSSDLADSITSDDYIYYEEQVRKARFQHDANLQARVDLRQSKL